MTYKECIDHVRRIPNWLISVHMIDNESMLDDRYSFYIRWFSLLRKCKSFEIEILFLPGSIDRLHRWQVRANCWIKQIRQKNFSFSYANCWSTNVCWQIEQMKQYLCQVWSWKIIPSKKQKTFTGSVEQLGESQFQSHWCFNTNTLFTFNTFMCIIFVKTLKTKCKIFMNNITTILKVFFTKPTLKRWIHNDKKQQQKNALRIFVVFFFKFYYWFQFRWDNINKVLSGILSQSFLAFWLKSDAWNARFSQ